jgi:hypothetical protein
VSPAKAAEQDAELAELEALLNDSSLKVDASAKPALPGIAPQSVVEVETPEQDADLTELQALLDAPLRAPADEPTETYSTDDLETARRCIAEHAELGITLRVCDFCSQMSLSGLNAEAIVAMFADRAQDWSDLEGNPRNVRDAEAVNRFIRNHYFSPIDAETAEPETAPAYIAEIDKHLSDRGVSEHCKAKLRAIRDDLIAKYPNVADAEALASVEPEPERTVAVIADAANDAAPEPIEPRGTTRPGGFAREWRQVFDSPQFCGLSFDAQAIVHFAGRRYKGRNNGQIFITLAALQKFGYHFTKHSLPAAAKAAIAAGFLVVTREQRGSIPALYGVTWEPLPGETKPRDTWRTIAPSTRKVRAKSEPCADTVPATIAKTA